jgi:hypothetical protein
MALLEGFVQGVGRLNALVEQYAAAKTGHDNIVSMIKRQANQLKAKMMGVGLDQMSQLCGAIEMAAGRPGNPGAKTRLLRELVGGLKFQLDLSIRTVVREDQELKASKAAAAEKADKPSH